MSYNEIHSRDVLDVDPDTEVSYSNNYFHNYGSPYNDIDEDNPAGRPFPKTGSTGLRESQGSPYAFEYWNPYISATGTVMAPSHSGRSTESTSSKDSGYGSAPSSRELSYGRPYSAYDELRDYSRAGVRSVQGKNTNEFIYR